MALSRTGWVANASVISSIGDVPAKALDGNETTRFSTTNTPQASGLTFDVDMLHAVTFSQVVLDAVNDPTDFPRGFSVFVSNDGVNWGSPVGSGAGTTPTVTFAFPEQTARFVRVQLTVGGILSWWSIDEFNVFSAHPPAGTPVPLSSVGWVASASVSAGGVPSNALDGNMQTAFGTGQAQASGQSFEVNMQRPTTFDQITMNSGFNPNDFPHGYSVTLSSDGVHFGSPIATGMATGPLVIVTFPPQTAQYIQVTLTAAATSFWSIAEFNVYAGSL